MICYRFPLLLGQLQLNTFEKKGELCHEHQLCHVENRPMDPG
jgi:hypothetical protein